jgi:hypothetical protein
MLTSTSRAGAQAQRQHGHQHQGQRDQEIVAEPVQAAGHVDRLVEAGDQFDIRGQPRAEGGHLRLQPVAQLEHVLPALGQGGHEDRALAVEASEVLQLLVVPRHLRHVAHAHHRIAGPPQGRAADLVQRRVGAGGLDRKTAVPRLRGAGGHAPVGPGQRGQHAVRAEAQPGGPVQVEGDPHLLVGVSVTLGPPHAGHRLEAPAQAVGQVLQPRVAGLRGDQRDLEQRDVQGLDADHVDAGHAVGEGGPARVDLAQHVVLLAVGVGAVREFHHQLHHAVAHGGAEFLDVVQLLDRILQRPGHQPLQVAGRGARLHGDDAQGRNVEVGILGPRNLLQ